MGNQLQKVYDMEKDGMCGDRIQQEEGAWGVDVAKTEAVITVTVQE